MFSGLNLNDEISITTLNDAIKDFMRQIISKM